MFEIPKPPFSRKGFVIKYILAPVLALAILFGVLYGTSWAIGKLFLLAKSFDEKYNIIRIVPPPK